MTPGGPTVLGQETAAASSLVKGGNQPGVPVGFSGEAGAAVGLVRMIPGAWLLPAEVNRPTARSVSVLCEEEPSGQGKGEEGNPPRVSLFQPQ